MFCLLLHVTYRIEFSDCVKKRVKIPIGDEISFPTHVRKAETKSLRQGKESARINSEDECEGR